MRTIKGRKLIAGGKEGRKDTNGEKEGGKEEGGDKEERNVWDEGTDRERDKDGDRRERKMEAF